MLVKAQFTIRLPGSLWFSSKPESPPEQKHTYCFVNQAKSISTWVTFDLGGVLARFQDENRVTWPINEVQVEVEYQSYGEANPDWSDLSVAFGDMSFLSGFIGLLTSTGETVQGLLRCFKYSGGVDRSDGRRAVPRCPGPSERPGDGNHRAAHRRRPLGRRTELNRKAPTTPHWLLGEDRPAGAVAFPSRWR